MKQLRFFAIVCLVLFSIVACNGSQDAEEPASEETAAEETEEMDAEETDAEEAEDAEEMEEAMDEEITMRYFMWDPSFEETEQIMVDKFVAAHPNVTIDFQTIGTPDYWTKLEALSAADDLPCVFNMSAGFVDQWISDGLLLDIQSYVDQDINPDEYYTGVFDVVRDKNSGNMHAFPFAFVETVMFYNKDAFDAAGVPYPEEGWTWDEFLSAAQALTLDDNDDGVVDQYGYWFYGRYAHIESWVYQNDGRFLNENKTRFEPNDNAVDTLAFLDSLIHEHGVAPEPKEMEGIRQQDVFPLGLAAMWVDGAWNINGNRETIGDDFNWGIAPIPRGPQATGDVAYGWPDSMSIASTCEHPDLAWEFINFMTGPERTIDLTFGGKIPIYQPVAFSDEFLERDQLPDNKEFLLEWANHTGPTTFTPGWGEWRGYTDGAGLEGQFGEVLNGESDLDTALANITEHANGVLERFYP
ncbi:MAG: sugar ABC transporter substrate-binding protein [Ardenticatenaceae bacterium]|nr:MAG: sugar ABC transporter substrate-binding protein [Ardenticatenaceae bacterium]